MLTAHVNDEYNIRRPQLILHDTEHPNFEARLAIALIERWGMVAAEDGGEDSSGRAKLRLQTPSELIQRACNTAELLAAEIRNRNWFVAVPGYDEMKDIVRKQRKETEEREEAEREERKKR